MMTARQRSFDLIQRTIIITNYLIIVQILSSICHIFLGKFFGGFVEVFLFSYLNSYYCYEYKTAAMDVTVVDSIKYFEE